MLVSFNLIFYYKNEKCKGKMTKAYLYTFFLLCYNFTTGKLEDIKNRVSKKMSNIYVNAFLSDKL